jgi:formylglycine-generating enzyme required for sulfatase activity
MGTPHVQRRAAARAARRGAATNREAVRARLPSWRQWHAAARVIDSGYTAVGHTLHPTSIQHARPFRPIRSSPDPTAASL